MNVLSEFVVERVGLITQSIVMKRFQVPTADELEKKQKEASAAFDPMSVFQKKKEESITKPVGSSIITTGSTSSAVPNQPTPGGLNQPRQLNNAPMMNTLNQPPRSNPTSTAAPNAPSVQTIMITAPKRSGPNNILVNPCQVRLSIFLFIPRLIP